MTISSSQYAARPQRIEVIHRGVPPAYAHYSAYSYHDSFTPMLTGYLLGRLSSPTYHTETVRYIHSHWDEFDAARREQLLRENAGLRAELAAMSGPRDPGYRMAGVDEDLLYADSAVAADDGESRVGAVVSFLFAVVLIGGGVVLVVYLLFIRDWS